MQVIALSCNDSESHMGWIEDIKAAQGISTFSYPIIADPKRELAVAWGMVMSKASGCCIRICSAMVGVPHRLLLPSYM